MPRRTKRPMSPANRMTSYRERMRAAGLKPAQIWVPDPRAPGFAEKCRRQALAIAKHDPAGDEAMRLIEATLARSLIRRGAFVVVAVPGDYGKPRPALVVQSDLFSDLPSVTICPLTSMIRDDANLLRLTVEPSHANGLRKASQIVTRRWSSL